MKKVLFQKQLNAARTTLFIEIKAVIDVDVTYLHIFAIELQSCFHS